MKTTTYFDLTSYYYYTKKLTFLFNCAHEKAEIIDLKKITILFDMSTKLFILGFKLLSFWQTIFKKKVKPTDLSLSSSTWIGLLQNLKTVKALTKVDNFSKNDKIFFFSFRKNISWRTESLCDFLIHHYDNFCELLLNHGHHRNIPCNATLFIDDQ